MKSFYSEFGNSSVKGGDAPDKVTICDPLLDL